MRRRSSSSGRASGPTTITPRRMSHTLNDVVSMLIVTEATMLRPSSGVPAARCSSSSRAWLTPGTTTVDIDMERGEMLLHLLDVAGAEEAVAGIRADFEPSIIRLFGTEGR